MSEKVLFISPRCEHCKQIIIGIKQHDFLQQLFNVVNIDVQSYPNYVKSVPCLLINGQLINGNTVFEYLGKLVDGKMQQETRVQQNNTTSQDQGVCRINDDGELEGWCGGTGSVEYSIISNENDDYTTKKYKIDSNYEFLSGNSIGSNLDLSNQIKQMESKDNQLSQSKNLFDSDFERLQRERGEIGNGMGRK